jgi:hypothetical protein
MSCDPLNAGGRRVATGDNEGAASYVRRHDLQAGHVQVWPRWRQLHRDVRSCNIGIAQDRPQQHSDQLCSSVVPGRASPGRQPSRDGVAVHLKSQCQRLMTSHNRANHAPRNQLRPIFPRHQSEPISIPANGLEFRHAQSPNKQTFRATYPVWVPCAARPGGPSQASPLSSYPRSHDYSPNQRSQTLTTCHRCTCYLSRPVLSPVYGFWGSASLCAAWPCFVPSVWGCL